MKEFVKKIIEQLEYELYLADEEKRKADVLQFDRKVGYADGISSAINIVSQLEEEYEKKDRDKLMDEIATMSYYLNAKGLIKTRDYMYDLLGDQRQQYLSRN